MISNNNMKNAGILDARATVTPLTFRHRRNRYKQILKKRENLLKEISKV